MTQQGARQATVRATTSTALTYEGDWNALFDGASIVGAPWDGRLLAWLNEQLGASYTELNGAMQAFAASQGAANWSQMGAFTISGSSPSLLLENGAYILLEGGGRILLG